MSTTKITVKILIPRLQNTVRRRKMLQPKNKDLIITIMISLMEQTMFASAVTENLSENKSKFSNLSK